MSTIMMLSESQQAAIMTIEDLVCYLLSFRKAALGLYNAWVMAKQMNSQGMKYNFTFCYMNQCQVFSWCQLLQLDAASRCPSLNTLLASSNTLEGVAVVLFKLRIQLSGLYATEGYANDLRSRGAYYVYTFVNPFIGSPNATNLATVGNSLKMNQGCISKLFCKCNTLCNCCQPQRNCNPITININSPFIIGTASGSFQITSSGGTSPYTYSYTGILPDGITLDNSGLLSWLNPGPGSFSLTSVDANGCSGTKDVSITET